LAPALKVTVSPTPTVAFLGCETINGGCTNDAATVLSEFMVTLTGLAEPLASPLHPLKIHPLAGVAVSDTIVLL
jgi:hypothetical protein